MSGRKSSSPLKQAPEAAPLLADLRQLIEGSTPLGGGSGQRQPDVDVLAYRQAHGALQKA